MERVGAVLPLCARGAPAVQPADAVYVSLGKILTISGRTIKEEAQFDPSLAAGAVEAINTFLAQASHPLGTGGRKTGLCCVLDTYLLWCHQDAWGAVVG
jgi:hypothetical protein